MIAIHRGKGWEAIPDWARLMVRFWRLFQGGEMSVGHIPEAGGIMDQSAKMLDSFALMSDFEARMTAKGAPIFNDDGEIDRHAQDPAAAASWGGLRSDGYAS